MIPAPFPVDNPGMLYRFKCPDAPGSVQRTRPIPELGDTEHVISFPTDDGGTLLVHLGPLTYARLREQILEVDASEAT